MKTQIIQLNQNDDALSVRDKMSWSQTGKILLVWPLRGRILNRQLDLNLVNRHVTTMGVQLALVTREPEVRFYARQMGIPVFTNLLRAQDHQWKVDRPIKLDLRQHSRQHNLENMGNNNRPPAARGTVHPAIRFTCFGSSILALLILGIFILPSAKINLFPQVEIQSTRFDLTAIPSMTSINPSISNLPTYKKEVIVEGHDTITSTGSMSIPDDPAVGNLKFTNISKQIITLPSGTIVTTRGSDPIRFITISTDEIIIDPNKSVVVPVRAIKPGSAGNLTPNKLVVIEDDPGLDLSVTNPNATSGGTDRTVATPTTQDLQILRDRLRSQLIQTALTEFQHSTPDEDTLISPTISMIETLVEISYPIIGDPGNQLELTMRVRFQSHVVSGEVLRSLVTPILDSITPIGYSPVTNTLEITQLSQPTAGQDGAIHWKVAAMRKLQADIPAYQVSEIAKGITVAKAKEQLSASLPLMEQAQIALVPEWWPRLPFLTMRIQVTQMEGP